MNHITFIGFASGWGAQVRETEKGPEALRTSGLLSSLSIPWTWKETIFPLKSAQEVNLPSGLSTLPYIEDMCRRTAVSVEETLKSHNFPVVIGGDHVSAAGTWAGVTQALNLRERFGLIWIDAHMDAHTMETTPSQAFHGMPLSALLGYGEPSLVNLLGKSPILKPEHVCLIGVRSYESGEAELLRRLGVRIYLIEEIHSRGFRAVLEEAVLHVKKGTDGFGLSLDLDAFDPNDAPGVGTPEPDGLKKDEVLPHLSLIQNDPDFKTLEIVEYNPERDREGKTLRLIKHLLINLLPKERGNR